MMGLPREMNKKNRQDEMKMINETTLKCEIGRGTYSSLRLTQGKSPGFARTTRQKKREEASPAPGIGKVFSSFDHVTTSRASKSKNLGWGTPRNGGWMQDPATPGVGSYTASQEKVKIGSAAVISKKDTKSRIPIENKSSPGPGEYVREYSSLRRGSSSCWRSPSKGERDGWRHFTDTPGPSYNPDDYKEKKHKTRSGSAAPPLGGSAASRSFMGHVNSSGFVATVPCTDAGPGDYTPSSDFDVASRTFNKYARLQSFKKSSVSSPGRSPFRQRSASRSRSRSP